MNEEIEVIITDPDIAMEIFISNKIPKHLHRFASMVISSLSFTEDGSVMLLYKEENNNDE